MGDKDIVEAPVDSVDEDLHGKKVSVISFDPQKRNRKKICLSICQADEVTIPLRAAFQKHEDEKPLESKNCNHYQYGVGLTVVANYVSGRFGAV